MSERPTFSIVTPVYNPPADALKACIKSVLNQTCSDWEWILVDDASTNIDTRKLLSKVGKHRQVSVIQRTINGGIVAASNDGVEVAKGEFIALLDHDDLLSLNAIERILQEVVSQPEVDYLYCDEDKIDESGKFFERFNKPKWSPERLRSQNYCCHLSVLRTSLVRQVGAFREGFDGSQDYDLILRVTEKARVIVHIPEVLYHWRASRGSTSLTADAKPYALIAAQRSVHEHFQRCGIDATVETTAEHYLKTTRRLTKFPKVSIIIPTCGTSARIWGRNMVLVETAVASVIQRSTYSAYEIVVIYDTSTPADILSRLRVIAGQRLVLVEYCHPFNFSAKINLGVMHASGEIVILLNDDTQIESPEWIEGLIVFLEESDVGMVGPKLLLEDGRIQSAGHLHQNGPSHYAAGLSRNEPGHFCLLTMPAERAGLTMACCAIPKHIFNNVGGLSHGFPKAFNDVDFGNKLTMNHYRIIWTPHVELYHFESLSRDPKVDNFELDLLYRKWKSVITQDPYLPD